MVLLPFTMGVKLRGLPDESAVAEGKGGIKTDTDF